MFAFRSHSRRRTSTSSSLTTARESTTHSSRMSSSHFAKRRERSRANMEAWGSASRSRSISSSFTAERSPWRAAARRVARRSPCACRHQRAPRVVRTRPRKAPSHDRRCSRAFAFSWSKTTKTLASCSRKSSLRAAPFRRALGRSPRRSKPSRASDSPSSFRTSACRARVASISFENCARYPRTPAEPRLRSRSPRMRAAKTAQAFLPLVSWPTSRNPSSRTTSLPSSRGSSPLSSVAKRTNRRNLSWPHTRPTQDVDGPGFARSET